MEYEGFLTTNNNNGYAVDFIMPCSLSGVFTVSLLCKSPINDASGGDPSEVWEKISANYGGAPLVAPHQVHGTEIIEAELEVALPHRPDCDGVLITHKSKCFGSLRFADCTPVVIAGNWPEPWLLMLHSGFTGTLNNIVGNALNSLKNRYKNEIRQYDMWSWIGPSICRSCYSRSLKDEKTKAALEAFGEENLLLKDTMCYIDIEGQIYKQLSDFGLDAAKIHRYGECTFCNSDKFYSYRAGDALNRMFLLGGVRQNAPLV